MVGIRTRSARETKKVAAVLAEKMVRHLKKFPAVILLQGNLGSGKTTFVQGFARALGIRTNVLSPTFVLMKIYKISPKPKIRSQKLDIKHLVHIDCYRIHRAGEMAHLGIEKLFRDKDAIVLIEWPERIRSLLPRRALYIRFRHGKLPHERLIQIVK